MFYGLTSTVSLNKLSYSCSAFCWHFKSSSFTLLFTSPHLVSFHFISSSHLFYEKTAIAIAYERMGVNFYQTFFNDLWRFLEKIFAVLKAYIYRRVLATGHKLKKLSALDICCFPKFIGLLLTTKGWWGDDFSVDTYRTGMIGLMSPKVGWIVKKFFYRGHFCMNISRFE